MVSCSLASELALLTLGKCRHRPPLPRIPPLSLAPSSLPPPALPGPSRGALPRKCYAAERISGLLLLLPPVTLSGASPAVEVVPWRS